MDKLLNPQRCLSHQKFDDPAPATCLDCKNKKIAHLEKQVESWKDAWYNQRAATGKVAWEIPSPSYLSVKERQKFLRLASTIRLESEN